MFKSWGDLEELLDTVGDCPHKIKELNDLEHKLKHHLEVYQDNCDTFEEMLIRSSTTDSKEELNKLLEERLKRKSIVRRVLDQIKQLKQDLLEKITVGSNASRSSCDSRNSNSSSIAQRKRAKANAEREKVKFAQEKANIMKQKAELDASLHVLKAKENFAAAEAEAIALEETPLDFERNFEQENTSERVNEYVNEHYSEHLTRGSNNNHLESAHVTSLAKFLLKKDLTLSRLSTFNDTPENYTAWKLSFQSVANELELDGMEHMDMLIKCLGPVSSRYAISIKSSNVTNPDSGVQKIWDRLDDRYGQPEMVDNSLKQRLSRFPKLTAKDHFKLFELVDLLTEIESLKQNKQYSTLLSYFDSSTGVLPIVRKLPDSLQGKWMTRASRYKQEKGVAFPPFAVFVKFLDEMSKMLNDPGLVLEEQSFKKFPNTVDHAVKVSVRKSGVSNQGGTCDPEKTCPFHNSPKHPLSQCKAFKASSFEERRKLLKDNRICFKCCKSSTHVARLCKEIVKCTYCGSNKHASPMHIDEIVNGVFPHGGELDKTDGVSTKCTQLCGQSFTGRSCSKTLLVKVFPENHPERGVKVYATIDDQSNRTLVKNDLLDIFGDHSELIPYTLASCSGSVHTSDRRAQGYMVQSLDNSVTMKLPPLIECDELPNDRSEIATPVVAMSYPHLRHIANKIPELDDQADIQILIGRDLIQAHQIEKQIVGPPDTPIAQKLKLGWAIVGEVCLGKVHKPNVLNVKKTHVLKDGRATVFEPCRNAVMVDVIFQTSKEDNKLGTSIEDREFLKVMDKDFVKGANGHWVAPLPFKEPRQTLSNNREMADVSKLFFVRVDI